jgi:hypothetical protein
MTSTQFQRSQLLKYSTRKTGTSRHSETSEASLNYTWRYNSKYRWWLPSELQRRVHYCKFTNVSEVLSASIIREMSQILHRISLHWRCREMKHSEVSNSGTASPRPGFAQFPLRSRPDKMRCTVLMNMTSSETVTVCFKYKHTFHFHFKHYSFRCSVRYSFQLFCAFIIHTVHYCTQ